MNKKRIICWSMAVLILVFAAFYNFMMITVKTQESEALCIRYLVMGCNPNNNSNAASSCCTGGMNRISHIWVGTGAYDQYASMCSSL